MKNNILQKIMVLIAMIIGLCYYSEAQTTFTSGNLRYEWIGGTTVKLIGHKKDASSASGTITIPETVTYDGNTLTVKKIGNEAFKYYHNLTGSLVIPNTVTEIGESAFLGCGFNGTLTLGNSLVTIKSNAFASCTRLHGSIDFPSTLTTIGDGAFSNCCDLDGTAWLPESLTELGAHAFSSCSGLQNTMIIPSSITTIKQSTFSGCSSIGGVVFHNNVTVIEPNAFYGCSSMVGALTLPSSLTSIGSDAFYGCSGLTGSLTIPNSVTEIGDYAFSGCSGFTGSLTLSTSLTQIRTGAFVNCSGLSGTLTIPNGVTEININAFKGCSGFTGNLTIPQSVISIKEGAFEDCSGLNGTLTVGKNVWIIKQRAFKNCGFANDVLINYPEVIALVGTGSDHPFNGVPSTTIHVLFSLGASYTASSWHEHFTNIIEDTGFTLNEYMYQGNVDNTLTVVSHVNGAYASGYMTVPSVVTWINQDYTVTTIGGQLFTSSNISSVSLPSTITRVEAGAISNCPNLSEVMIFAETPPTLGNNAFANIPCNTLQVPGDHVADYQNSPWHSIFPNIEPIIVLFEVNNIKYEVTDGQNAKVTGTFYSIYYGGSLIIPETVTYGGRTYTVNEIGNNAFWLHQFTGSLVVPNTVTKIGNGAFSGCQYFSGPLTIPNSVKYIGNEAFNNCTGLNGQLTLPNSLEYLGSKAFSGCTGLIGNLELPATLTKIGNGAFKNCSGLTGTLVIPESVTSIGDYNSSAGAFDGCTGFTGELIIPNSVTVIGASAFRGCTGFTGDLTIPNTVAKIGSTAFEDCSGLNGSLTIGSSVDEVGPDAFSSCGFTGGIVMLPEVPPTNYAGYGYSPFSYMPHNTMYVPFGCLDDYLASTWNSIYNITIEMNDVIVKDEYVYHYISGHNVAVRDHVNGAAATGYVEIPSSFEYRGETYHVTAIEENAFVAASITGVKLPSSITAVGANAFKDCANLMSVEVCSTTPPTLGANAFYNIPGYTLKVPCGCSMAYESSPWSDVFYFFIESCAGVEDVATEGFISVYPNPTSGLVKVECENLRSVSIFNMMGQQIFNSKASGDAFEYNFNGNTGMYLIRVKTSKGVETKRVIVM